MSEFNLGNGVKFKLYGKVFEIIKMNEGDILTTDISCGVKRTFTEKQLLAHACNENLTFEIPKGNKKVKQEIPFADYPEIHMLSQREKDEMDFKFKAIKPLLSIEGNLSPHMYKRQKEIETPERKVSVRSLYCWVKAMKESGGDIRSLIPNYKNRGSQNKRLQSEVDMIIDHVITQSFTRREKIGVNTVLESVVHEVDRRNKDKHRVPADELRYPSMSTISRRIREKSFCEMTKVKYRKKAAWDKFETVKMQVVNGSEFNIKELKHARDMLNIDLHHCPSRRPWIKGPIERYFKKN